MKLLCVQVHSDLLSVLLLRTAPQNDFMQLLSLWKDIEKRFHTPWSTIFTAARENNVEEVFKLLAL